MQLIYNLLAGPIKQILLIQLIIRKTKGREAQFDCVRIFGLSPSDSPSNFTSECRSNFSSSSKLKNFIFGP